MSIPHRKSQQYATTFPPPVYYRDTFGLQPINNRRFTDSITTDGSDNDSLATKSTGNKRIRKDKAKLFEFFIVRTTMNIYHPMPANNFMFESQYTDASQSYQVKSNLYFKYNHSLPK